MATSLWQQQDCCQINASLKEMLQDAQTLYAASISIKIECSRQATCSECMYPAGYSLEAAASDGSATCAGLVQTVLCLCNAEPLKPQCYV